MESDAGLSERLNAPNDVPDLTGNIVTSETREFHSGGFGDVHKCKYNSDDGVREVAVKTFRFDFSLEQPADGRGGVKVAKMIRRELGIWRRLKHPNIVPFLGVVHGSFASGSPGSASLVSLWMSNGTLQSFLSKYDEDGRLTVGHRLRLLLDVANGLVYLHSFPIAHGDLSCNNILIDHDFVARLTDFGYASVVGEIPEVLASLQMSTQRPGTLRWAAPEHFSVKEDEPVEHTTKSDIYSFGNLALLVLSGKHPWSEIRHDVVVVLHLYKGEKPGRPESRPIEDRHWELIEHCWSSMDERPRAEDLVYSLEHFLSLDPAPQSLQELLAVSHISNITLTSPDNGHDSADAARALADYLHQISLTRKREGDAVSIVALPPMITTPQPRAQPPAASIHEPMYSNRVSFIRRAARKVGFGPKIVVRPEELQRFSSIQLQQTGATSIRKSDGLT